MTMSEVYGIMPQLLFFLMPFKLCKVNFMSCCTKNNFIYQPVAIRQLQFLILERSKQNPEYVDQTHNPAKQERASSKWTSNCYVHCTTDCCLPTVNEVTTEEVRRLIITSPLKSCELDPIPTFFYSRSSWMSCCLSLRCCATDQFGIVSYHRHRSDPS